MSSSVLLRLVALGFLSGILARSFLHMSRVNAGFPESSVFLTSFIGSLFLLATVYLSLRGATRRSNPEHEGKRALFVFLLTLLLGILRFETVLPKPQQPLLETPMVVEAVVLQRRETARAGVELLVAAKEGGRIQVGLAGAFPASVREGARIRFSCRLLPPRAAFSDSFKGPYRSVFRNSRTRVHSQCTTSLVQVLGPPGLLDGLRYIPRHLAQGLTTDIGLSLEEPASSVLSSFVFGSDEHLSPKTVEVFRRAGTLHLLVVSGSHFSLLARWLDIALARWVPALGLRALGILGGLFSFLALVGFPAPAVRGFLLSISVLAGALLRRPRSAFHLVVLIAAAMVAVDPWLPLFHLGFQLSVLATLGIVTLAWHLETVLGKASAPHQLLASTIAATLATTPLLLGAFGSLSLVSVVANVASGFFGTLLFGAGALFIGLRLLASPLADVLSPAVALLFSGFVELTASFADVSWAAIEIGRIPGAVVALYCLAFVLLCWRASGRPEQSQVAV